MKKIYSISLAVISSLSAIFSFSSCQKDEIVKGIDSKYVTFKISMESGVDTKTAQPSEAFETVDLSSDELSLFVTEDVNQNTDNPFEAVPETKGSVVTSVTEFAVTMRKPDGSVYGEGDARPAFGNENDSYWSLFDSNDQKIEWPETGGNYQFWSYAGADAANYTKATADNKIAYVGNAPATAKCDAASMKDFIVAYSSVSHDHAKQNLVGLHFYHALAAVRFDFSGITGATVTKVMINNVAKDGVATYNTASTTYDAAFSWNTTNSAKVSYAQSDLSSVDNRTFFIVPQSLNDVTITFTLQKGSKEYQITSNGNRFGSTEWKAGCIYTYTVSTTANGNVGIQVDENFANQTKKTNVKVTNTKRSTVYVRARVIANWCTQSGRVMEPYAGEIDFNTESWVLADDGCYYSVNPVVGYESSENLINEFTCPNDDTKKGFKLVMTIMAQAVECDNAKGTTSAIATAWPTAPLNQINLY